VSHTLAGVWYFISVPYRDRRLIVSAPLYEEPKKTEASEVDEEILAKYLETMRRLLPQQKDLIAAYLVTRQAIPPKNP